MSKMSELHAAIAQAEALESEPIITNAMIRGKDQARIAELEAALAIAADYMLDHIAQERIRYAGYKPAQYEEWARDEAQVKAALGEKL